MWQKRNVKTKHKKSKKKKFRLAVVNILLAAAFQFWRTKNVDLMNCYEIKFRKNRTGFSATSFGNTVQSLGNTQALFFNQNNPPGFKSNSVHYAIMWRFSFSCAFNLLVSHDLYRVYFRIHDHYYKTSVDPKCKHKRSVIYSSDSRHKNRKSGCNNRRGAFAL